MASSADVRDIMGMDGSTAPGMGQGEITKEMILGTFDKPKKNYSKKPEAPKRPEGMARELYNLLYSDSKDAPSLIPSDASMGKGGTFFRIYFIDTIARYLFKIPIIYPHLLQ